jgi:hypothetical protein
MPRQDLLRLFRVTFGFVALNADKRPLFDVQFVQPGEPFFCETPRASR